MKHRCNRCDPGHYERNYFGEMRCDTCGYKPCEPQVNIVVPVCVPEYTFVIVPAPIPPIQWVKVQFNDSYKNYSYLCDLQDVSPGDNLVIRDPRGDLQVVECMSVHRNEPPCIAYKHILDKTVK